MQAFGFNHPVVQLVLCRSQQTQPPQIPILPELPQGLHLSQSPLPVYMFHSLEYKPSHETLQHLLHVQLHSLTRATSAQSITSTPLATEEVSDHSNSKGHGGLDTVDLTVAMHAVQALGQCRTGGRVRGDLAGAGVGCGCGRAAQHTHRRRRTVWRSDRPLAAPLPSGTGTWTSATPWTRQAALLTLLHALQPTWKVSFGVQIFACEHQSSSHIRKDCCKQ
jgi:hypothetical protein